MGPLKPQLKNLGIDEVDFVYNAFDTDKEIPLTQLMVKRISFSWELMFTRPLYGVDLEYQGFILNAGARMIDSGALKMPDVKVLPFDLESLKEAHAYQESGKAIGKTVLTRENRAAAGGS